MNGDEANGEQPIPDVNGSVGAKPSDERATPDWLFRALDRIFNFGLDAAASLSNAKCKKYLTKADDALLMPWQGYGPVFLNPPYSRGQLQLWLEKAANEAQRSATGPVVTIVPGDFSTHWFAVVWQRAQFVLFLNKRVAFDGIKSGAKFATAIAVFGAQHGPRWADLPQKLEAISPGSVCIRVERTWRCQENS